jgi:diguanylate cyclase (GGDEF)-like protein/PAS domain S-box-containing protein
MGWNHDQATTVGEPLAKPDDETAEAIDWLDGVAQACPHGLGLFVLRPGPGGTPDFECRFANAPLRLILGEDVTSLARLSLARALARLGAEGLMGHLVQALDNGRTIPWEVVLVSDSRTQVLRVHAARAGAGLAVLFEDISRQRQLERALATARDDAQAAVAARADFLSSVSHELRQPLNTIIGFAEIIKDGLFGPIGNAKYTDYIQDIFRAGRNLLGLLDDFLDLKRLEDVSRQGARGYRALLDIAPDMICLTRGGRIIMLNAAGADMLGVWPASRVEGERFGQFLHPDYQALADEDMSTLIGERCRVPIKFLRADGSSFDAEVAAVRFCEDGEADAAMVVARDITERNRAIRAVLQREERLRQIMNTVAEGILCLDEQGLVESVNPAAQAIFGCSSEQLLGQPVSQLMPELQLAGGMPAELLGVVRETVGRHKDGRSLPIDLTVNDLKLADKKLYIAVVHDVTRRKEAEAHLRFLAGHDPLTGLPNRSLFQDRLADAIGQANRGGDQAAVLFIDLDGFKRVNDAMGHRVGDMVLQAVARRLEACVRTQIDTVARLGGDEFTVILPQVRDGRMVSAMADRILSHLFQPFHVEGREIYLSGSVGVAMYPSDGEDIANVLRNVDMAAHQAKRLGGNNFQFFSADLGAKAVEHATLERGLRHALERGELHLAYQPKIHLADLSLAGAEALLRWTSPELGCISPVTFIPVAEETGMIVPIGTWVIRAACEQVVAWQKGGLPPVPVSVNLSARQFRQPDLVESVRQILVDTGIDPRLLQLELTESMLVENAVQAIAVMKRLKDLGVTLSIDDFGTGYSSLAYLKRFPVDALKIDRSFVKDIPNDKDDMAIACAVINLAKTLGLRIIAEGIEELSQAEFLRDQSCDEGQGYLFSKPIPAEDFAERIGEWVSTDKVQP